MIRHDTKLGVIALETAHTSYLIDVNGRYPVNLYWGCRIDAQDAQAFSLQTSHSSFDADILRERSEYPEWDARTFGQTAFQAQETVFLRLKETVVEGEKLTIRLLDEKTGHTVLMHYTVYPEWDVIEKHAEAIAGTSPLTLYKAASGACCLPATERKKWTAHYTAGSWAGEFRRRRVPLGEGVLQLQATRGMSGPQLNPSLLVTDGADDAHGRAFAVLLGWSGCWQITARESVFGNAMITAGMHHPDFRAELAPGEHLLTPPMYLCQSEEGIDGISRRLHDFERRALHPSRRARRVLYNSWEATFFDVRAREQMALADRAAQMGVELFVIDDGWFGQRFTDKAGLGDWVVNESKFPNGLEELIDHVKGLGMAFGLWVEPESVNPDSDLFRAHPDWIHRLPDREPIQYRNQYLLNFSKPEVEAFALDMLRGLLKRYEISYLKWDMNRPFADIDEQAAPLAREKHVLAVYRILETLRREFPQVDVEACSGGGARVDLGMISRTDQFWPSDNTDPYERLFIQSGCSLCYAPSMTSCWVTDTPKEANRAGRDDLRFKFHVAMCGGLGIGANISRFTPEQIDLCAQHIAAYKRVRHLVEQGDLYRIGLPEDDDAFGVMFCAKDKKEFALLAFQHSQRYGDIPRRIRLRGLNPAARYTCVETGESASGSTLMHMGVALGLKGDFDSALRHYRVEE